MLKGWEFENFQRHFCTFNLSGLVLTCHFIQVSSFNWTMKHQLESDLVFQKQYILSPHKWDNHQYHGTMVKSHQKLTSLCI